MCKGTTAGCFGAFASIFQVLNDAYGRGPDGRVSGARRAAYARPDRSDFAQTFGDWQPSAVVFDCDGLLMDTESLWILTQRQVSESYGVLFDADLQRRLVGLPASRIGPIIASRAGADPKCLVEQLLQVNMTMVTQSAVPMPGARSFVAAVSSRVPVAVASNSARRILDQTLLRGAFAGGFSVTVSADEVAHPKPEPDVYLAAVDAMNLHPKDCLAFEDSEAGATAARSAGMKVIAIPASPDQQPGADLIRDSLEASDLLNWVQGWAQVRILPGLQDPPG
jgi:HAD superfamily hydrolase (TIGR01509 family)